MWKYLHAVRVISHRPLRLTVSLDLVLSLGFCIALSDEWFWISDGSCQNLVRGSYGSRQSGCEVRMVLVKVGCEVLMVRILV